MRPALMPLWAIRPTAAKLGGLSGQRRLVTVAGKESDDVKSGTLAAIRQQSGLPRRLFR